MKSKIDKFFDKLDWTFDLVQETRIGERTKLNRIEKLLYASTLFLTSGVF